MANKTVEFDNIERLYVKKALDNLKGVLKRQLANEIPGGDIYRAREKEIELVAKIGEKL